MIRHDPTWLCPRRTRLYINYLGKVYGKNELDFHFWNPDHVTAVTSPLSSIGVMLEMLSLGSPLHVETAGQGRFLFIILMGAQQHLDFFSSS